MYCILCMPCLICVSLGTFVGRCITKFATAVVVNANSSTGLTCIDGQKEDQRKCVHDHSLVKRLTVLFTSPRQQTPAGLRVSQAHSPSRINLEILSGILVRPVCAISS